jgi:hypothetical protein
MFVSDDSCNTGGTSHHVDHADAADPLAVLQDGLPLHLPMYSSQSFDCAVDTVK